MSLDFELAVWRILGGDLDLRAATAALLPVLADRLPIDLIIVRHIDRVRRTVETLAVGSPRAGAPPLPPRSILTAESQEAIVSWDGRAALLEGEAGSGGLLDSLVPSGIDGVVAAGPLADGDGPVGALVLALEDRRAWTEEERDLARGLFEPFAAAVRRELQLEELGRLREALEADKQALLTRLQRDEIVDSIVGADAGLREVMARVGQVAPTDAPVLILGETGAGKEVVARAIHQHSRRHAGPMVRVNCGAIAPELVDSELFGHERGSFTGAVATRKGWFERADGGTLFLDEFGELSLAAQVRLLRILQDGTLERVGGQRTLTVDVRVVAATAVDLEAMVAAGRFREDLWYRVSIFPIRLPPLRERKEDIPSLALHFSARIGKRLGGRALVPAAEDLELMLAYDWPGNVRELAAVIERAAILGSGKRLELAVALGGATSSVPRISAGGAHEPTGGCKCDDLPTLAVAMARHIEKALAMTSGRIEGEQGAARVLGINPHTLRARMRKLGVDWSRFRPAQGRGACRERVS